MSTLPRCWIEVSHEWEERNYGVLINWIWGCWGQAPGRPSWRNYNAPWSKGGNCPEYPGPGRVRALGWGSTFGESRSTQKGEEGRANLCQDGEGVMYRLTTCFFFKWATIKNSSILRINELSECIILLSCNIKALTHTFAIQLIFIFYFCIDFLLLSFVRKSSWCAKTGYNLPNILQWYQQLLCLSGYLSSPR